MNEEAKDMFNPENENEGLPGGEMTVYSNKSELIKILDLVPQIDFEAMDEFYNQIEEIVKKSFKYNYHYGPAYEAKPGKSKPPDILYKRGLHSFEDRLSLIFQDEFEFIREENGVDTFHCKCKMFRNIPKENVPNNGLLFLSNGAGSCSTDEGRFSFSKVVSSRQVREGAMLRAHKDAAERFFNISRFFPGDPDLKKKPVQDKPKQQYTPKSTPHVVRWNPTPQDVNNPQWYKDELKKLTNDADISAFATEFKTELSCFSDKIQEEIAAVGREQRLKLKGDKK